MGPRPHACLSNPDESPHCPVHTAGFLQLVRIVDPDHPLQAASQASIAFAGGGRTPPLEVAGKAPTFVPKPVQLSPERRARLLRVPRLSDPAAASGH